MQLIALLDEDRRAVLDHIADCKSWAGRMEEWDRTDTSRFDPSTIAGSGLPSYVENLLPESPHR